MKHPAFIITGTDTGIGKTVCSAVLTLGLKGCYWKPVQSGTAEGTDTQAVRTMTGLPDDHFLPEVYCLKEPLSPHRAAELDGVVIDPGQLEIPDCDRPLIVEGAGGLMVPLTREVLYVDVFRRWNVPVILCARTGLGTINHTLLSVEVLKSRGIPLHGLVLIGPDNPDNMRTIREFTGTRILGHIPPLPALEPQALQRVFEASFDL
ncbi:MAG: dethiobiotin synthase [Pseudomonadota bacterium]|nr:dethiobiotin synthase [Pseudomonadota bacterium]